ncbi:MAG TPA: cation transporter, partial [Gammaproteobacteria bacterium]|nr:cation transporter [Gammaproteobacteria bacterium]
MKNPIDAQTEAVRITLIGMALDLALGLGKIVGGIMSASFALVADGVHSLTDAVTDIFVLVIARTAYAAPDRGHPYGHGRFEAVGT